MNKVQNTTRKKNKQHIKELELEVQLLRQKLNSILAIANLPLTSGKDWKEVVTTDNLEKEDRKCSNCGKMEKEVQLAHKNNKLLCSNCLRLLYPIEKQE